MYVSIPYRQSRYLRKTDGQPLGGVFQFLIGSLGTFCFLHFIKENIPFQFLIGSLGTISAVYVLTSGNSFNSLQVVQVLLLELYFYLRGNVSIPYRQSRYDQEAEDLYIQRMFQFLIGSLDTYDNEQDAVRDMSFNSLQVVQVPVVINYDYGDEDVSIPYRQSRYLVGPLQKELEKQGFNSLQVVQVLYAIQG